MSTPVLRPGTVYLTFDSFVCSSPRCAGSTALYSGYTTGGFKLSKVTKRDIRDWADAGMGPLVCQCGAVTAS